MLCSIIRIFPINQVSLKGAGELGCCEWKQSAGTRGPAGGKGVQEPGSQ